MDIIEGIKEAANAPAILPKKVVRLEIDDNHYLVTLLSNMSTFAGKSLYEIEEYTKKNKYITLYAGKLVIAIEEDQLSDFKIFLIFISDEIFDDFYRNYTMSKVVSGEQYKLIENILLIEHKFRERRIVGLIPFFYQEKVWMAYANITSKRQKVVKDGQIVYLEPIFSLSELLYYESLSYYIPVEGGEKELKEYIFTQDEAEKFFSGKNMRYFYKEPLECAIYRKFGNIIVLDLMKFGNIEAYRISNMASGYPTACNVYTFLENEMDSLFYNVMGETINVEYFSEIQSSYFLSLEFFNHYNKYMTNEEIDRYIVRFRIASSFQPNKYDAMRLLEDSIKNIKGFELYLKVKKELEEGLKKVSLPPEAQKVALNLYRKQQKAYVNIQSEIRDELPGYYINLLIGVYQYGRPEFLKNKTFYEVEEFLQRYMSKIYLQLLPSMLYMSNKLEEDISNNNAFAKKFKSFFYNSSNFLVRKGWSGDAVYIVNDDTIKFLYADERGKKYLYRVYGKYFPRLSSLFKEGYSWTEDIDKEIIEEEDDEHRKKRYIDILKTYIYEEDENILNFNALIYNGI